MHIIIHIIFYILAGIATYTLITAAINIINTIKDNRRRRLTKEEVKAWHKEDVNVEH
jgi:hypothetical protein